MSARRTGVGRSVSFNFLWTSTFVRIGLEHRASVLMDCKSRVGPVSVDSPLAAFQTYCTRYSTYYTVPRELWTANGCPVFSVPTNKPARTDSFESIITIPTKMKCGIHRQRLYSSVRSAMVEVL